MTGKIQFLFASSFFMGMFAGAYFYVTFFAPQYGDTGSNVVAQDTLVIEGAMYGGCQMAGVCASFQLIDGREYTYNNGVDRELPEGRLPSSIVAVLKKALYEEALTAASEPIINRDCDAYIDGSDYHYTINKGGVRYELDTCTTMLAYDSELQDVFFELWYAMENPDAIEDEPFKLDLGQILYDRFNNVPVEN